VFPRVYHIRLEVFKSKYFLEFLKVWGLGLKVLFLCCFRFRVYGFFGFRF